MDENNSHRFQFHNIAELQSNTRLAALLKDNSLEQLKEMCRKLNLKVTGSKQELARRIIGSDQYATTFTPSSIIHNEPLNTSQKKVKDFIQV